MHVMQLGEVNGALTQDLSEGGLYLECTFPYPVGACVPVRLIDPRSLEQLPAVCEVARQIRDAGGKLMGLGLRFTNLDAGLAQRLKTLVGALSEPAVRAAPPASLADIPLDSVPALAQDTSGLVLHPMEAHLLRLVDGRRNADRIAQESGLSLVEALAGLLQLKRRGLIQTTATPPPTTRPARLTQPQLDAQQTFAGDRVREYMSEAVRCERGGRLAEAVSLLELALALDPPNSRDIHARLCRLALGALANVELARRHLAAVVNEDPDAAEAKELDKAIAAREKELAVARAKAPRVLAKRVAVSGRRRALGLAGAALLLGTVAFNAWTWLVPHGDRPQAVNVAAVSAMLPCEAARLFKRRLYVTVSPQWHELPPAEQERRLVRVLEWAKKTYAAEEVLASDSKPVLVGRAAGGQAVVYRGKR
ncbi:MAG: PilZ domain-containing protein [Deltaproteobacteria bacterium]|nr:PilZ domain-containing protein [Deltaproteobacteria bacterium]